MGTGAVSILFQAFPYGRGTQGMMTTSLVFFFLNLLLFILFTAFFLAKYLKYPGKWSAMIRKPIPSLFLGCYPMGACTLLNVSVDVINQHYGVGGRPFLYVIWALWWVDVAISVACCWAGVHSMIVMQTHSLATMNSMWLLPVVTLIVASSSGGVIGLALQQHSEYHALITVGFSAFLVTIGISLAFMILTIYLARLVIHGLPPGPAVLSVFLPLGPTGQSGFAIYIIGQNFSRLIPYSKAGDSTFLSSPRMAEFLSSLCTCAAFVLWSLGTMWLLYALLALKSTVLKTPIGFKMSFWGLVFPNGVYANLTLSLATAFDSKGFRIYGAIYAIVVICVWTAIALRSLVALKQMSESAFTLPVKNVEKAADDSATTSCTDSNSDGQSHMVEGHQS